MPVDQRRGEAKVLTILITAALIARPDTLSHDPEAAYVCSVKLRSIDDGLVASYTLYADAKRRALERHVHLRTRDFTIFWHHEHGLRSKTAMGWFDAWFPVPKSVSYPVTMQLKADGRVIARIKAWRPSNMSEAGSAWFMSIEVPNIFGVAHMDANVTDSAGQLVGSREFALPNWAWLEREAEIAGRTADRLRRRDKCDPALTI